MSERKFSDGDNPNEERTNQDPITKKVKHRDKDDGNNKDEGFDSSPNSFLQTFRDKIVQSMKVDNDDDPLGDLNYIFYSKDVQIDRRERCQRFEFLRHFKRILL
ncbi:hypothetical protein JCGZ_19368 [Jatropha curcas]|uniref:Uncharacterized protein n=1 Tax=Jatropha curcas TaxID=180498 RepID=A0A067K1L2_JATCU|nr:hypothetical protein JCGZ_19368 [Jatropha curcas]